MDWGLTYYSDSLQRYCLRPYVSIEDARVRFFDLSPDYIPHSVSKLAQQTSKGDAGRVSDFQAFRRYKRHELSTQNIKLSFGDEDMVQDLGLAEAMYLPRTFGEYLARVRKSANLSQTTATKMLRLSHSSLARYECGETLPTIATIRALYPLAQAAGLRHDAIQREYIVANLGAEEGTIADIVRRERWFAQMNIKELAFAAGLRPAAVRYYEKAEIVDTFIAWVNLEKIAKAIQSIRLTMLAREMRKCVEK